MLPMTMAWSPFNDSATVFTFIVIYNNNNREVRRFAQTGNPAHHQLCPLRPSVDSGQSPSQRWWSWSEMCVFAPTSRLFGFCGEHIVPPGRHPD